MPSRPQWPVPNQIIWISEAIPLPCFTSDSVAPPQIPSEHKSCASFFVLRLLRSLSHSEVSSAIQPLLCESGFSTCCYSGFPSALSSGTRLPPALAAQEARVLGTPISAVKGQVPRFPWHTVPWAEGGGCCSSSPDGSPSTWRRFALLPCS